MKPIHSLLLAKDKINNASTGAPWRTWLLGLWWIIDGEQGNFNQEENTFHIIVFHIHQEAAVHILHNFNFHNHQDSCYWRPPSWRRGWTSPRSSCTRTTTATLSIRTSLCSRWPERCVCHEKDKNHYFLEIAGLVREREHPTGMLAKRWCWWLWPVDVHSHRSCFYFLCWWSYSGWCCWQW